MRKLGIGLVIGIVVTLIAFAVRSQVHEPQPVERSGMRARQTADADWTSPATVAAPANATAKPAVIQPVTQKRPVVSADVPTVAEPAPAADAEVQDGATVLKRASVAYTNLRSMRADFVQRRENPLLGSNITSRGTIYQRKPDRLLLKFSDPAGDVIVSDGRYFWLYYPSVDRRQVLRSPATSGDAGAVDLQAQFIGDPLKRFRYTYNGRQNVGDRAAYVLTLTPRQNAGYKTLKVWVDANDYLVRRFQITEETGALVEFQLNNLETNAQMGDNLFRFTPPAGARIVER